MSERVFSPPSCSVIDRAATVTPVPSESLGVMGGARGVLTSRVAAEGLFPSIT